MDHDETYPISAVVLVQTGLVPSTIVGSSRDYTKDGLAVDIAREALSPLGRQAPDLSYRLSYVGFSELGYENSFVQKHVYGASGAGWLVDLSDCSPRAGSLAGAVGSYRRLMFDGSVQKRVQTASKFDGDGQRGVATHPLLFFIDEDFQWLFDRKL